MHKKQRNTDYPHRFCSYEDFCKMYGIGLTLARKYAKEHDLTVHIGRRVLIDLEKAEQSFKSKQEV